MEDKTKATCTFVAADVQAIFAMSEEQAEDWLERNRQYIEERMSEEGYETIQTLGAMDDLPPATTEE